MWPMNLHLFSFYDDINFHPAVRVYILLSKEKKVSFERLAPSSV